MNRNTWVSNDGKHKHSDTASQTTVSESAATLLWKPEIFHISYCSQTTLLLASVLISTNQSARRTDEEFHLRSETQEKDELVSNDTVASTDMSVMSANLNTVNV